MADTTFTAEELHAQAQGNAAIFPLVTIAYLRERGLSVDDWAMFVGQRFAPSWSSLQGGDAVTVARFAARNIVAEGARLVDLSGGADRGEAVIADWPDHEAVALFGLTPDDADPLLQVFQPIAEYLGLQFVLRREGENIHLIFMR